MFSILVLDIALYVNDSQLIPSDVKIFSIPFNQAEINEDITINTNTNCQLSKEEIIDQAFKFHSQGNILEAEKY
ncbi:MAG: hypothetical protein CMB47_06470, partial [Euryarchaeota archaeon]|nr:hypothetical protein [Euryarchaeota archaeon]